MSDECLRAVSETGYVTPTLIQEKAIPALMSGRDVLGKSNTGTGKTAAFMIPAVEMIKEKSRGVKVIILSPTRELAIQTFNEAQKLARFKNGVCAAVVVGGKSIRDQTAALSRADIAVGTPGRILDHIRRGSLKLDNISFAVLDEADEMLDMGFHEDINEILSNINGKVQTALFSATIPAAIRKIADKFLSDPVVIEPAGSNRTLDKIEQIYYSAPREKKTDVLKLILSEKKNIRSIVFCNTKRMVDKLNELLTAENRRIGALHGDMSQAERTKVMDGFKAGRYSSLIATDVAARGIDVDDLEMVVNYDLPQNNEYYIHRIGRTGRAGKSGLAVSLITDRKQERELKDIISYVGCEIEKKALPSAKDIKRQREEDLAARVQAEATAESAVIFPNTLSLLSDAGLTDKQIASALLNILVKKENLDIKDAFVPEKSDKKDLKDSDLVKLRINAGRNEKMAANFILGALTENPLVKGADIGRIDILSTYTLVSVTKKALEALTKKHKIKIKNSSYEIRTANKSEGSRTQQRFSHEEEKRSYAKKKKTPRSSYTKKYA